MESSASVSLARTGQSRSASSGPRDRQCFQQGLEGANGSRGDTESHMREPGGTEGHVLELPEVDSWVAARPGMR